MGAFFLHKKNREFNLEKVEQIFLSKNFSHRIRIEIDDWDLYLYPKMIPGTPFVYRGEKGFLAVIGSVTYKDYRASELLERLYEDLRGENID